MGSSRIGGPILKKRCSKQPKKNNKPHRRSDTKKAVQQATKNKEYEIAKNAIKKGFDNETIVDLTGLSIEEIETLRAK